MPDLDSYPCYPSICPYLSLVLACLLCCLVLGGMRWGILALMYLLPEFTCLFTVTCLLLLVSWRICYTRPQCNVLCWRIVFGVSAVNRCGGSQCKTCPPWCWSCLSRWLRQPISCNVSTTSNTMHLNIHAMHEGVQLDSRITWQSLPAQSFPRRSASAPSSSLSISH